MFRLALVLVAAALAGACANLPAPPRAPSPPAGGFELNGRVSVRHGSEGISGSIYWRHSSESDDLLITSPLGQGVARISRRGPEVQLIASDGRQYRASDAESLSERVLGWRLPLAGLPDWMQARPRSGGPAELSRDGDGRVIELRQDDWSIEYQEYQGGRPSRLRLRRDDMEIRLVIDRWDA